MLVLERSAPVSELVSDFPVLNERAIVISRPTDLAVVLGSTQPIDDVDAAACAAAGLSVARRRSGGGAVFVGPGRQLWVDLFVPASDPVFDHDVGRAPIPVGEQWVEALVRAGLASDELGLHRGKLIDAPFSRQVCFLGLGPGEVTWNGRKVVGLSQRRTRAGAWFFTMAPLLVDPVGEAAVFALDLGARDELAKALADKVAAVVAADSLERHLVAAFTGK